MRYGARAVLVFAMISISLTGVGQNSSAKTLVSEPPEFSGTPKTVPEVSPLERQFLELSLALYDEKSAKEKFDELSEFIKANPTYADAYSTRALTGACKLGTLSYEAAIEDLSKAISLGPSKKNGPIDNYSLRAWFEFSSGRFKESINDLEVALRADFYHADTIFSPGDVKPQKTSPPCTWNLSILDKLVAQFPRDYRPLLYRGLYYSNLVSLDKSGASSIKSLEDFRRASLLNPKSPLPHYYIGGGVISEGLTHDSAWSSESIRSAIYRKAVLSFSTAITLDPKFVAAYERRASLYADLKDSLHAIRDYSKVIELDPENVTAYNYRGLEEIKTGQVMQAIFDFGDSIRRAEENGQAPANTYESRADAYMRTGDTSRAIADFNKAIENTFASQSFLLSLDQIRNLYPEFDQISDDAFCRRLQHQFWPQMKYEDFADQLRKNGKWRVSFLLSNLYEKRGDAYLREKDFRAAAHDFARIFKGVPNMASSVDRWRWLGKTSDGDLLIDIKSLEFPDNVTTAKLWAKMQKKLSSSVIQYEFDCRGRKYRISNFAEYNSTGAVVKSINDSGEWSTPIPSSIGEELYLGMCSTGSSK